MKGTGLAVSLKSMSIQLQRYNKQELITTIVDQYSMGYKKILFQSFSTVHLDVGCQSKVKCEDQVTDFGERLRQKMSKMLVFLETNH